MAAGLRDWSSSDEEAKDGEPSGGFLVDETDLATAGDDIMAALGNASPGSSPSPVARSRRGAGARASFLMLQSPEDIAAAEVGLKYIIDPGEADAVRLKLVLHQLRHWRASSLEGTVRTAMAALDQAEEMTPMLRWASHDALPAFPPLVLQRERMGLPTGSAEAGGRPQPFDAGRPGRRGSIFASGLRAPQPNSLPVEYRPARPSAALSNAMLHAFVMFRRWEHKAVVLPQWRVAERVRQQKLLVFSADDLIAAIQQGPGQLERFTAGRYVQALHSKGRPPPMLMGAQDPAGLRDELRPLVRRALELSQLVRFLEAQERRRQIKSRRTSVVQEASRLHQAMAIAAASAGKDETTNDVDVLE